MNPQDSRNPRGSEDGDQLLQSRISSNLCNLSFLLAAANPDKEIQLSVSVSEQMFPVPPSRFIFTMSDVAEYSGIPNTEHIVRGPPYLQMMENNIEVDEGRYNLISPTIPQYVSKIYKLVQDNRSPSLLTPSSSTITPHQSKAANNRKPFQLQRRWKA